MTISRLHPGSARGRLGGVLAAIVLCTSGTALGQQIIPADFFSRIPEAPSGQMAVSAETMVLDQTTETVTAQGRVGIAYQGYSVAADRAVYDQANERVELIGNVEMIDPQGNEYVADRVELTDGFERAFVRSLTVALPDGTWVTAADTLVEGEARQEFVNGVYSPCGACVGTSGQTIGWRVKAARIVTDDDEQTIYFEQPALELLGIRVAQLPWLTVPRDAEIDLPVYRYGELYGHALSFPLVRQPVPGGTLVLTPTLFSRQGLMLGAELNQSRGPVTYDVATWGIYQLQPEVFSGLAERRVRGAVQTSGTFTPTDEWTMGWSYTAFTDPGFLPDYDLDSGTVRNRVYAEYLTTQSWATLEVAQYVPLGNRADRDGFEMVRDRQALKLPQIEGTRVIDLPGDAGRVELAGKLLGLSRGADDVSGTFVHGYAGTFVHLSGQMGWTDRWIAPGGVAVSPYLGGRLDLAQVDTESMRPDAPGSETLFTATPIAALDVRYPLVARGGGATHVVEPIAQLVYRGSADSVPGIVNNDAQSVVLDGASLFSFDRFSGADRQETGLRANVGVAAQTTWDNGAWINAIVGQSFHLAGANAFDREDGSTAGIGAGLSDDASYIVGAVEGAFNPYLGGGLRVQYDPAAGTLPSLNLRATAAFEGFTLGGTYAFADSNAALGVDAQRHDVGVNVGIPVADYWTLRLGTSYDLVERELIRTTAALEYDDRYLAFGLGARADGPPDEWQDDFAVEFSLKLRSAQSEIVDVGYSWE